MKTLQKVLVIVAALGMLAAAGCKQPVDLSMQRSRIFLLGRLLVGKPCEVRLIWRKAPQESAPVTVTADLRQIGGLAEQELTTTDNNIWRWTGQVMPDVQGERLITITAVDAQEQKMEVRKRFRVFYTDKAIAIDAGGPYALKADGTVAEWNFNDGSQTETPAEVENVTAIAAGSFHRLALKTDGTVVAWGCEDPEWDNGQCDVKGLADVVAIAAGSRHSLALKADGTVVALGGYGVPWEMTKAYVPAGLSDVVAIAAGSERSAAVKADGTVVLWPYDYALDEVVSVALGGYFDLALKADGTVTQIQWGKLCRLPVRVGKCNATAIASGSWGNIALQKNGSVVVWDGESAEVFHRLNNIIAVAASGFDGESYIALAKDGRVIAWVEKWSQPWMNRLPVPDELK